MSNIGRFIRLPPSGYQWGQFRDEYGNNWNVNKSDIPSEKETGDNMAYRLDFSDPAGSPKIVEDSD